MEIKVNWLITYLCNRSCSYCYVDKSSPIVYGKNHYLGIIRSLKKLGNNNSTFYISLLGGEPMLSPFISDITYYLKQELPCRIRVISNGDSTVYNYKHLNFVDDFIISIHLENYNPNIINVINNLRDKVEVHIMKLPHSDISYIAPLLNIDMSKIKVMDIYPKFPKKDKLKRCLINYNTFEILPNGNVKGAICSNVNFIGNIKNITSITPTWVECSKQCFCLSNNRIPKYYV